MISWLTGLFTSAVTAVKDLASRTLNAFQTLWHRLVDVFSPVYNAWGHLWSGARSWLTYIERFGVDIFNAIRWLIVQAIPQVLHYLLGVIGDGLKVAAAALADVRRWAVKAIGDVLAFAKSIPQWVIDHVFRPLTNDFLKVWHWITTAGATLETWIAHPETLAKILLAPIWRGLLHLFIASGAAIAKYLWTHMRTLLGESITWIEDVLAAII